MTMAGNFCWVDDFAAKTSAAIRVPSGVRKGRPLPSDGDSEDRTAITNDKPPDCPGKSRIATAAIFHAPPSAVSSTFHSVECDCLLVRRYTSAAIEARVFCAEKMTGSRRPLEMCDVSCEREIMPLGSRGRKRRRSILASMRGRYGHELRPVNSR
jgi:hypothetical protein